MSAAHHPSETTLLDFAGGNLRSGARLVVSAHLESCAGCRADVAALESAAGAMMAELPSAALDDHALDLALARIERPAPPPRPPAAPLATPLLKGVHVPAALRRADVGPTRWMAPGIRVARLGGGDVGERTYLLRVAGGMRLPEHSHHGDELTLVLAGSFHDAGGHYQVGDLVECGKDDCHDPTVDDDGDCVCLISSQGAMRLREWLPRLLQPLFGV
jgi:putative transcriptional regulator